MKKSLTLVGALISAAALTLTSCAEAPGTGTEGSAAPSASTSASGGGAGFKACMVSDAGGFDDALMMDWRGQVAEATGANAFFIRDGIIHTPTPDCFLNGLTRQTLIDLARRRGRPTRA